MCGADERLQLFVAQALGSSPRVRGRPIWATSLRCPLRLIPACAGQTESKKLKNTNLWAHPRVCGADSLRVGVLLRRWRLIPACAGQTSGDRHAVWRDRAHPRVCGADAARCCRQFLQWGSSPRVRGRLAGVGRGVHALGAHPRVCGADFNQKQVDINTGGSSPRVRGRHHHQAPALDVTGLIPACAGQTQVHRHRTARDGAHPRVCGADGKPHAQLTNTQGSSPRVRVRLAVQAIPTRRAGLIPACAGQTTRSLWRSGASSAHPRVCGADLASASHAWNCGGSSPRVRGRPAWNCADCRNVGLIPACAGQTRGPQSGNPRAPGSSPRVRGRRSSRSPSLSAARLIPACAGQTRRRLTRSSRRVGSSPRVRGRLLHRTNRHHSEGAHPRVCGADSLVHHLDVDVSGLIPACAGQTSVPLSGTDPHRAHPRVCGADVCADGLCGCNEGSSPRVRGRLLRPRCPMLPIGLIPACAGQTVNGELHCLTGWAHPRVCGADRCKRWDT